MKVIKTYTEQTTGEKLYSLLLNEDEVTLFSKMEDEDYLEELRNRKRSVKHAKAKGALLGGIGGAFLGGTLGAPNGPGCGLVGASVGAISGSLAGYKLGKNRKKAVEKYADREIEKYQGASEADKKYLRARHEKQIERELQERQTRAQERQVRAQRRIARRL